MSILLLVLSVQPFAAFAQDWSTLNGGVPYWVHALTVYNGDLIAGGEAPGYIRRWDGSAWVPLGSGLSGQVDALTIYNSNLIAGGHFFMADTLEVGFIASWDGSSWIDLEGGTNSIVTALTVYNGNLIAGGYFTDANGPANYVAQWDGHAWSPLGVGVNSQVMALTTYGTGLIAAGFFSTAGGVSAMHVAAWNGTSWSPLGAGVNPLVYALTVFNGHLIAGGNASWDGTAWTPLTAADGPAGSVMALAVMGNELIAGGNFTTAGGVPVSSIASWNGATWSSMNGGMFNNGSAIWVFALHPYGTGCAAGGIFRSAGATSAQNTAIWMPATAPDLLPVLDLAIQSVGDSITLRWTGRGNPAFVVRDDMAADGAFANVVAATQDTFITLPLDSAAHARRFYAVHATDQLP
ncbi:hypothetical protein HZB60_03685 [candidate division KSB1 bacterium]|nr:hypothetical protein [candidate division KSB1 bacterium]